MEKREPYYTVGGNVNWYNHYGESYNPAISLLGIYPEKTVIRKNTCTPMFIAALFKIVKT